MPQNPPPHVHHRCRMRKRYAKDGIHSFAEHEALEVYLFRCLRRGNTNPIAHALLQRFGSLSRVFTPQNGKAYREIRDVGEKTALALTECGENMNRSVLSVLQNPPGYNENKTMVFARYMLRRIPEEDVLILRYNEEGQFRACTVIPGPEADTAEWSLKCLAATKTGEELHFRIRDDANLPAEAILRLSTEMYRYGRRVKSIMKITDAGETQILYK